MVALLAHLSALTLKRGGLDSFNFVVVEEERSQVSQLQEGLVGNGLQLVVG